MTIEQLLGKIQMSELRNCDKRDNGWDIEIWLTKLAVVGTDNGVARMNYPEMIRAIVSPKAKVGEVKYKLSTALFTISERA